MNKKVIPLILIGTSALIVSGLFLFSNKEKSSKGENRVGEEKILTEKKEGKKEDEERLPALEEGVNLVCKYKVENGLEFTTYIKGRLIKTTVNVNDDINHSLFRDDKVYQWSEKQKRGFVMSIEEAKKQPNTQIEDPDKYIDEIKVKYKPDCKKVALPDSIFAIPSDVQFEDLSKLLPR